MNINNNMIDMLQKIINEAPEHETTLIEDDFISEDLGEELIQIYSATENLETRELITGFMHEAGYKWLRRLMTRDAVQPAV